MTRTALLPALFVTACTTETPPNEPRDFCCTDSGYFAPDTGSRTTSVAPIAVCSVDTNPVAPPSQTAHFNGSPSYSPIDLDIVGLEWTLINAPDGNAAPLASRTGVTTTLTPQLSGEYHIELTVIDELGVRSEEPCTLVLQAIPLTNLQIEMFWSHANDDMDLHLVRPGGTARTFDDCFSVTCIDGIDWGVTGDSSDDVRLLASDVTGVGPEIIQIETNEVGDFNVFVHDNPAAERTEPTDVTVNIVLDGELSFSQTRRITGEDSDTPYATVNLATGLVTAAP